MVELVEVIAKALVEDKEAVRVTSYEDRQTTIVQLKVAEDDIGKVIGRNGRIAKALRAVVKAAAVKQNAKVIVEIIQ